MNLNPKYSVAIRGAISPTGDVALEFVHDEGDPTLVSFPASAIPQLKSILDEMQEAIKKKGH